MKAFRSYFTPATSAETSSKEKRESLELSDKTQSDTRKVKPTYKNEKPVTPAPSPIHSPPPSLPAPLSIAGSSNYSSPSLGHHGSSTPGNSPHIDSRGRTYLSAAHGGGGQAKQVSGDSGAAATLSAKGNRTSSRSRSRAASRSRTTSSRNSIFPAGDARNEDNKALVDLRSDMMVNHLYEQLLRKQYATGMDPYEGIVLKKEKGSFTCCPPQMAAIPGSLYDMICQMNVRCAMTVNTPVVRTILESITARSELGIDYVPLADGLRVQILPTMTHLPSGQLHHFAAFIEDAGILVVWDDEPERLMERAENMERKLMEMIWGTGEDSGEGDETPSPLDEKKGSPVIGIEEIDPGMLEEALNRERRPVRLESACVVTLTLALCITCLGIGWRAMALESMVDGTYVRWALLSVSPIHFFVSLVRTFSRPCSPLSPDPPGGLTPITITIRIEKEEVMGGITTLRTDQQNENT